MFLNTIWFIPSFGRKYGAHLLAATFSTHMFCPLGSVPLIFGAYEPVPSREHPHRSDWPERGSSLHGGREWKEVGGNDGR